jgi:hydrogenase maturation factor
MGKLLDEDLRRLLKAIKKHPKTLVPPQIGFDSGVHELNENLLLVVSTDPCVNVPQAWFGWLLVNYAASDVAIFGAHPQFCTITLLGQLSTESERFIRIMKQVSAAAEDLQMGIITGHTGTYKGLSTMLGVCTAYGTVPKQRLITPGGARPGDQIICTKSIGLETVVNFTLSQKPAAENLFGSERTRTLRTMVDQQTCVKEAQLLSGLKGVHAMHDATEGGIITALNEMAGNARLGFRVNLQQLPISEEVKILQNHFRLSETEVLSTSSTGTLLAALSPDEAENTVHRLEQAGIKARSIGVFSEDRDRRIYDEQQRRDFPNRALDPYSKIVKSNLNQ